MHKIAALAAFFLAWAGPAGSAIAQVQPPDLTLTGSIGTNNLHTYIEVPFAVPAGVNRLTLVFEQDGGAQHTVIDMGVLDPERFRGWSGGARSSLTLAATDATPGYLAGPLPKGGWKLLLGVPNIRSGVTTHYGVKIWFERSGARSAVSSFAPQPLRSGPAWYRGDLHAHTAHSDGSCMTRSGTSRVPCPAFLTMDAADRRGLDFIAITDHNTMSQYDGLRELQPYFDRTLIIPGRELTTFEGHANAWGAAGFIDFRLDGKHVKDADALIAAVHRASGLFSINHPASPSGEACMGCGWQAGLRDYGQVDAVEVINGGTVRATGRADDPYSGFIFWQSLLDKGFHPTAVGGSDNHDGTAALDKPGSIGSPATMVYARDLSQQSILDGLKAGHAFIDVEGSASRALEFQAQSPRGVAMMGDHLTLEPGERVDITAHVMGAGGGHVEFVHDAALQIAPVSEVPLGADDRQKAAVISDGNRHWLYLKIWDGKGGLALVSNPIYFEKSRD